jgi:hypothetical protein
VELISPLGGRLPKKQPPASTSYFTIDWFPLSGRPRWRKEGWGMTSSIIIDLRFFLRRRDLPPRVNGSVGRLNFSRYGFSDLASPNRSWIISHGCRKEYYPHNNFLRCYILDNGDSCSQQRRPDCSVTFPGILVLVVLPMVIDYFNGCTQSF